MAQFQKRKREDRNREMAAERALGVSIRDLATKYDLRPGEVTKGLQDAEKAAVLELVDLGVYRDILPKALAVLEYHLETQKSLKAVEIAMALFGALKTNVKAKNSFEINLPSDGRPVGIVALDEIRKEKLINAPFGQRHDPGAAPHDRGEPPAGRDLRGEGPEHQRQGGPGEGSGPGDGREDAER